MVDRDATLPDDAVLAGTAGLWVDAAAIDPGAWVSVPLHVPAAGLPRWHAGAAASACWPPAFSAAEQTTEVEEAAPVEVTAPPPALPARPEAAPAQPVRAIPAECLRRLPERRGRVTRVPSSLLFIAQPRRRFADAAYLTPEERRSRLAAWALLVVWLVGTWGTFFTMTGGIKSNEKSRALVSDGKGG